MSGYILGLRKVVGCDALIMAAAGVILIDPDGKILLQLRSDNQCWGITGGSMELGESFEETARREVFEETGLVVGKLEPLYLNSGKDTFYEYPNGHQVYLAGVIYTSTDFHGEIQEDVDETLAVSWFNPAHLPTNLNPLDIPALQFYLRQVL
jgi:8-oxo-dGTP pyrophosphatase MutT (NUDIX family)